MNNNTDKIDNMNQNREEECKRLSKHREEWNIKRNNRGELNGMNTNKRNIK